MNQRGLSMLETTVALALAGTFVSAAAGTALHATRTLAALMQRSTMLATARNRIETARALPCSAPPACPPDFECRLQHNLQGSAVEIISHVRRSGDRDVAVSLAAILTNVSCS